MKRLLIASILLLTVSFVFSQKATLKEYTKNDGVTAVTIPKNMLSLFPKNSNITYGGINVAEFVDKLSDVNVFASRKDDVASKLIKDATEYMKIGGYDNLVSMKTEKEETINFYIKTTDEYISELVLIVQRQSKESAVMQLMGKFTMEDIQEMIASAGK
ncbi:MAG TPA: DUF4252 domain-containing protein [Bacteroidales bacterium]|nr:DUF4252 domain-containing protein [Bacteroidales bacterium]